MYLFWTYVFNARRIRLWNLMETLIIKFRSSLRKEIWMDKAVKFQTVQVQSHYTVFQGQTVYS